jgi:hypothetical protein
MLFFFNCMALFAWTPKKLKRVFNRSVLPRDSPLIHPPFYAVLYHLPNVSPCVCGTSLNPFARNNERIQNFDIMMTLDTN